MACCSWSLEGWLFHSTSVTLSWNPPENDGGSHILGYTIESCIDGLNDWKKCSTGIGPLHSTTTTIENLSKQLIYIFRVSAYNEVGVGSSANVPGSVKPEDILEKIDIVLDEGLNKDCIEINAGATLKLSATIKGRPDPKIKWTKMVSF